LITDLHSKEEESIKKMTIVAAVLFCAAVGIDLAGQRGTLIAAAKHSLAAEPSGAGSPEPKTELAGLTRVMAEDFEKATSKPTLWVVGIPNENASVQLSADHPYEGKQCLRLHYHFTGSGQYMGINQPLKIHAPIHKLRFMLYGDGSGTGYGLYQSFFFLVNLATGGGWPVDLSRYNGLADMYIDFVRVYQGKE
jgi:hypothetical protein